MRRRIEYPITIAIPRAGKAAATPDKLLLFTFPADANNARAPTFTTAKTVLIVARKVAGSSRRACIRKTNGGPLVDVDVDKKPLTMPSSQS